MFLTRKDQIVPGDAGAKAAAQTSSATVRGQLPVVGKLYPTYKITDVMATCPAFSAVASLVLPVLFSASAMYQSKYTSTDFDRTLAAFEISDHETSWRRDSATAALRQWRQKQDWDSYSAEQGINTTDGDGGSRPTPWRRVYIQFEARQSSVAGQEGPGVADLMRDEASLRYMRALLSGIARLPSWEKVCWRTSLLNTAGCVPPASTLDYVFPGPLLSTPNGSQRWQFDLTGPLQGPVDKTYSFLGQNPRWQWFTASTTSGAASPLLRAQITLGSPASGSGDEAMAQSFVDELMGYLAGCTNADGDHDCLAGDRTPTGIPAAVPPIRVTFGGDGITDGYVRRALRHDRWVIAMSVIVLGAFTWLYTHSLFIAACTLLQITLCFFSSLFFLPLMTDSDLTLLTVLALFVTLGLCADGVMVFFNTFRHSGLMLTRGRKNHLSVAQRLAWCYRKAGIGISASHAVACVAFGLNITSPVPAVSSFGLLMCLLTVLNVLMFLTFFPSIIVFHHYHVSGRRRTAQRQKEVLLRRRRTHAPAFVNLVSEIEMSKSVNGCGGGCLQGVQGLANDAAVLEQGALGGSGALAEMPSVLRQLQRRGSESSVDLTGGRPGEATTFVSSAADDVDGFGGPSFGSGFVVVTRRRQSAASVLRLPEVFAASAQSEDRPSTVLTACGAFSAVDFGESEATLLNTSTQRQHADAHLHWLQCGLRAGITGMCFALTDPATGRQLPSRRRVAQVAETLGDVWPHCETGRVPLGLCLVKEPGNGRRVPIAGICPVDKLATFFSGVDSPPSSHEAGAQDDDGSFARMSTAVSLSRQQAPEESGLRRLFSSSFSSKSSAQGPRRRFGRFGKRVGETRGEKDSRILSKRTKQEGFSVLERGFVNIFVPLLRKLLLPLLTAWTVGFVLLIVTSARYVEPAREPPRLLESAAEEDYLKVSRMFPISGSCDFCSAALRPWTDWSSINAAAVAQCGGNAHSWLDTCDVCQPLGVVPPTGVTDFRPDGTPYFESTLQQLSWESGQILENQCLDCDGAPYGTAYVDKCGRCVRQGEPSNVCLQCGAGDTSRLGWCSPCYLAGVVSSCGGPPEPPCFYGKGCNVRCDATLCPPERGRCDPLTGECVCHSSYETGFFVDDPVAHTRCSKCAESFYPLVGAAAACRYECDPAAGHEADPDCVCDPATLRCRRCEPDGELKQGTVVTLTASVSYGQQETLPAGLRGTIYTVSAIGDNAPDYSILWSGLGHKWVLSPDVWKLKPEQLRVGFRCMHTVPSHCVHGSVQADGTCKCDEGWDDKGACTRQEACGLRGRVAYDLLLGRERCFCDGQWDGEVCERCKCRNGGTCRPDTGECMCDGVWEGYDCTSCPKTCVLRGRCPWHWPENGTAPIRGDERYLQCSGCRGFWTGRRCDVCSGDVPVNASGVSMQCQEDGTVVGCDGRAVGPSDVTDLKVVDECGVCGGKGECLGCDGIRQSGLTKDACGECGGMNSCFRSHLDIVFGVHGDAVRRRDGELSCVWEWKAGKGTAWEPMSFADSVALEDLARGHAVPYTPEPAGCRNRTGGRFRLPCRRMQTPEPGCPHCAAPLVTVLDAGSGELFVESMRPDGDGTPVKARRKQCGYDLQFDLADREVQAYMHRICRTLLALQAKAQSEWNMLCLVVEFAAWVRDSANAAQLEQLVPGERLRFPFEGSRRSFYKLLLLFAMKTSRLDDVGFTTSNLDDPDLRVLWMRIRIQLSDTLTRADEGTRRSHYDYWERIVRNINSAPWANVTKPVFLGHGFQWSDLWIALHTEAQARHGVSFTIAVASAVFVGSILVFTTTVRMAVCATLSVAGTVVAVLSVMRSADWTLGPIEQIGLSVLLGLSAECTVHVTEGYLEYLHATQSSLLARLGSRSEALAGTLQRTGVPLLVSLAGMLMASALLLGCNVLVFQRVGHIMIINILAGGFHGLVMFSVFLLAFGPNAVSRTAVSMALYAVVVVLVFGLVLSILWLAGEMVGPQSS
eukprot:TRINITY_DN1924_c1_g1_i1.p1 TRINITY_DN1924_c1_g1~~TRINITY_DN1924_c1_g1_i1.p1  ORF type:complete len:1988 (+),score=508.72 TRINITY_DN1924_c1_g1_i1:87-6050(+)